MNRFAFGWIIATSWFALVAAEPAANGSFLRADDYRLAATAHRIAIRGARLCPVLLPASGVQLHHLEDYQAGDRPGMVGLYGLDRGPGILTVVEGSAAARAGLFAGDVILAVNGQPLGGSLNEAAPLRKARPRAARDAIEDQLEAAFRQAAAELTVLRRGEQRVVRIDSERGCPARVRLARSKQVNGFAGRGRVVVTTGLLAEIRSDDELAIVLGHELAHVILAHPERLAEQKVPRGFLRGIGRNAARVHLTEQEADRLGIKLAWAAGYDVKAAIPFWRRFYAKHDGPQLFRTHPSLSLRERIIAKTLAELKAGAQRPELREGPLRQR